MKKLLALLLVILLHFSIIGCSSVDSKFTGTWEVAYIDNDTEITFKKNGNVVLSIEGASDLKGTYTVDDPTSNEVDIEIDGLSHTYATLQGETKLTFYFDGSSIIFQKK